MNAPDKIQLLQKSKLVKLVYTNGDSYDLSCEYLRVNSPSAEVKGHGGKGGTVPENKENVNILAIEPVGNYAVKFIFDDGHNSGIYSWDYLFQLATKAAT